MDANVPSLQTRLLQRNFSFWHFIGSLEFDSLILMFFVQMDICWIDDFALQGTWQAIDLLDQFMIGSKVEIPSSKFITFD